MLDAILTLLYCLPDRGSYRDLREPDVFPRRVILPPDNDKREIPRRSPRAGLVIAMLAPSVLMLAALLMLVWGVMR